MTYTAVFLVKAGWNKFSAGYSVAENCKQTRHTDLEPLFMAYFIH